MKFRCLVCGHEFEGEKGDVCPLCGMSGDNLEVISEDKPEIKGKWVCNLCGYEVDIDELPDDYVCPLCGASKDQFTKVK